MAGKHQFGSSGGMATVNNIGRFRVERGLSRPKLAELMNTTYQQVERLEKGQRKLTQEWIDRAAIALDVAPAAIISDEVSEPVRPVANATVVQMEGASIARMSENLPVYGSVLGADRIVDDEAIEQTNLNQADVIGYVKRPGILDGNAKAYGLHVQGSSMAPVHVDGSLILAERDKQLRIGDDVVVFLRPSGDADGDHADDGERVRMVLIKRLVRRTANYVELQQFTPAHTFRIETREILRIDRVLTLADLLS